MLEHESFTQLSQLLWGQLGQLSKQQKNIGEQTRVEIEILKNQSKYRNYLYERCWMLHLPATVILHANFFGIDSVNYLHRVQLSLSF